MLETAFTTKGKKGRRIPNNTSFPVTYCDPQLVGLHSQIVEGMFDLLSLPNGKGLDRRVFLEYMTELGTYLTVAALHASVFFKHEAYGNEKEYRFLQIHRGDLPPPEVKLRSRPYSLIKCREFAWKKRAAAALTKIVIGPAADRNKAAQFARDCLNMFCPAEQIEIVPSGIPYRVP